MSAVFPVQEISLARSNTTVVLVAAVYMEACILLIVLVQRVLKMLINIPLVSFTPVLYGTKHTSIS